MPLFHVKQRWGEIPGVSRETLPEGEVGKALIIEGVQLDVSDAGFWDPILVEIEFRVPIQDQGAPLKAPSCNQGRAFGAGRHDGNLVSCHRYGADLCIGRSEGG